MKFTLCTIQLCETALSTWVQIKNRVHGREKILFLAGPRQLWKNAEEERERVCSRMEIEFLSFHLDLTSTCSTHPPLFASRSLSSSCPLCTAVYTTALECIVRGVHGVPRNTKRRRTEKERKKEREKKYRKGVTIESETSRKET